MGNQVTIVGYDKIEYTTELVVISCARCGIPFGMSRTLNNKRRDDGDDFYCTNGHANVYRDTEADKLKRRLDAAERRAKMSEQTAARARIRAQEAERSASAYKGVATKARQRAGHGVCPAGCNRQFPNLQSHMDSKHPGWADKPVTPQG